MNFKDTLADDLDIFFDEGEFAEEVNIDGKPMLVVPDNDLLKEYNLKNGGEGLAVGELLFQAKKNDFQKKPSVGSIMRYNNKIFNVLDVTETYGTYTVTLERYQS